MKFVGWIRAEVKKMDQKQFDHLLALLIPDLTAGRKKRMCVLLDGDYYE